MISRLSIYIVQHDKNPSPLNLVLDNMIAMSNHTAYIAVDSDLLLTKILVSLSLLKGNPLFLTIRQ